MDYPIPGTPRMDQVIYFLPSKIIHLILRYLIVDSPESAEREIKVFFKDFDIREWYDKEEIFFRQGHLKFDPNLFVHMVGND